MHFDNCEGSINFSSKISQTSLKFVGLDSRYYYVYSSHIWMEGFSLWIHLFTFYPPIFHVFLHCVNFAFFIGKGKCQELVPDEFLTAVIFQNLNSEKIKNTIVKSDH